MTREEAIERVFRAERELFEAIQSAQEVSIIATVERLESDNIRYSDGVRIYLREYIPRPEEKIPKGPFG